MNFTEFPRVFAIINSLSTNGAAGRMLARTARFGGSGIALRLPAALVMEQPLVAIAAVRRALES